MPHPKYHHHAAHNAHKTHQSHGVEQINLGMDLDQWTAQPGGDGLRGIGVSIDPYSHLQRYRSVHPVAYLEPVEYMGRASGGPFATSFGANEGQRSHYYDTFLRYQTGLEVAEYIAPAAPIRHDSYEQQTQWTSGQALAGEAPQTGIYTGIDEVE